ncbi:MAG TPA: translation initiation factor IF-2 [Phycisphaerae bacterium]|nr:translation initiation factor IF-2 [Phycisphaerae bacterium]
MAKKRIHELAKELNVTSKAIIDKCAAEGLDDIVKTASSGISAGLEETIRDWFSEGISDVESTAVETSDRVDIEKAHEEAQKTRRRGKKEDEESQAVAEEQTGEEIPAAAEQPTEQIETIAEVKEEVPPQPTTAVVTAQEQPAEQPTTAPEPIQQESPKQQPAATDEKPAAAERPQKRGKTVKPAGPMLIPKPAQLKGPRVVRMEQPDYAPKPQGRFTPARSTYGAPHAPAMDLSLERKIAENDEQKRKTNKRRSPRRKGKTNAEVTTEQLREWRNVDLIERAERIADAGHTLRRHRPSSGTKRPGQSGQSTTAATKSNKVEIQEPITIKDISAATGIKASDMIKKLMQSGMLVTINQVLSTEKAEELMIEYGVELVIAKAKSEEEELIEQLESRPKTKLTSRSPVVTFLGHVDHGKTSLLDYLRKSSVAAGEAGGITQAIGAYRHEMEGGRYVVFLDTPGHEAFTAMRARGANMTDVVVLVVAADDGVMPQTIEAISHAKAAGVPIVVALNKIDVPNANPQRAMSQLADQGLNPREWGGDVEVIQTSAIKGTGMADLLEVLLLEAELLELKAEKEAPASGYVVEARMDPGRGVVATLLNINGTLKVGDTILCGKGYGRVRQIYDDKGKTLDFAGPANPVAITGLDEVPEAGDKFYVVDDLEKAREVAEQRRTETRNKELAATAKTPRSLEELLGKINEGEIVELPIILKADVQGSIEAIVGTLKKLGSSETRLNIIHAGVGGISSGDVMLAEASNAVIIGFNVVADTVARKLAEQKGVDIRTYRVIYDIVEDMTLALEKGLAPEMREEELGQAEIRQLFRISRVGTIAGCYVTEGLVSRNAKVRIIRDSVVIEDGRDVDSLKRLKDDAREVKAGLECGIKIKGYDDLKESDILAFYRNVEVARKLG